MISENRKLEIWNFLTSEKNQPRPKGITTQRLAVIRQAVLDLEEVWFKIIDPDNIGECSAADFYGSNEPVAINSRTEFWSAVRKFIRQDEIKTIQQNQPPKPNNQNRPNTNLQKRRK